MTIQQLEYILAVDKYRHFAKAAEHCMVTQPTLSMMIRKLEGELGFSIFNRDSRPVEPTKDGREVIIRSKEIITKANQLKSYAGELNNEHKGDLKIGIIPTLAPYLLPLFLSSFTRSFSGLKISIKEIPASEIVSMLKTGELDIGILSTPLHEPLLVEQTLFYEEFYVYVSGENKLTSKKQIRPQEIDWNTLWLLEEGHCMRNQVYGIFEMKGKEKRNGGLQYDAGNLETLINIADRSNGITIIPYLASRLLKSGQAEKLHEFADPKPAREISLVTIKNFPRKKILENLRASILGTIPSSLRKQQDKKIMAPGRP